MAKLEDLALFENAHSSLAFREHPYAHADAAQFLQDALALANAEVDGPRFLFIGVRDAAGGQRTFPGIDAEAMSGMRRMLPTVLARYVEPPLTIALRSLKIQDATVALIFLSECGNAPYLLRKSVAGLPAGIGWLRRGTKLSQLTRADLQRLFAQRLAAPPATADVRIAFAGNPPCDDLELAVLDLAELPSALAASRLKRMLEAKKHAKEVLGRTETHFNRLSHAQIFGVDRAYERHSDESLRLMIDKAMDEHAAADRYYELALRTHKLELVACNRSGVELDNVMLRLQLANLPGLGVAERLHSPTGLDAHAAAYPLVTVGKRVIEIEASIGVLAPGATVEVFREPPRLWVREPAAGKSIALDYSVHARGLREPVRGSLIIRFAPGATAGQPPKRGRDRVRAYPRLYNVNATISAPLSPATETIKYCLPSIMYVIGRPPTAPGSAISATMAPVALSRACSVGAPPHPSAVNSSVFVTSVTGRVARPVHGMSRPLSAGFSAISFGVGPLASCHRCSPLFMSIAVMRPHGGLISGNPCSHGSCAPPPLM